jgi:hypothetical protein
MKENIAFITEKPRRTPITENVDVVVAGGGLTGVMAAVSAARAGCSVVLVESKAYLGGVATMGLPIQGYVNKDNERIVAGLAEDFRQRLLRIKGASEDFIPCSMHNPYLIVDPEKVKLVCLDMLEDAGVKLLLHSYAGDTLLEDNKITALFIEGKSGREALLAKVYIDCTGDADIAARSGVSFSIEEGNLQSPTLNFKVGGVNIKAFTRHLFENPERYDLFPLLPKKQFRERHHIMVGIKNLVKEAKEEGFEGNLWSYVNYITTLDDNAVVINSVHVKDKNGCDTRDLTFIESDARRQVFDVVRFLKKYVPGFEESYLASTAGWAGIRETRRIQGIKTITVDDILAGRRPDDTVALGGYPIDIHRSNDLIIQKVPTYGIPYGCLVPQAIDNLLVAGRCISATHEAMASTRLMAQCMALGEAAGIAASLCCKTSLPARSIDVLKIRKQLKEVGACI